MQGLVYFPQRKPAGNEGSSIRGINLALRYSIVP